MNSLVSETSLTKEFEEREEELEEKKIYKKRLVLITRLFVQGGKQTNDL